MGNVQRENASQSAGHGALAAARTLAGSEALAATSTLTACGPLAAASDSANPPLVLLCECAGTMPNIDFGLLEEALSEQAEVLRHTHWCSRQGQARLLELAEADEGRRLILAGCSQDFAARRFHRLLSRGLKLEVADIREGCAWVHGASTATPDGSDDASADAAQGSVVTERTGTVAERTGTVAERAGVVAERAGTVTERSGTVTDKALRIVRAGLAFPEAPADRLLHEQKVDAVLVIGGGVTGTQAACELAQMGHRVDLVERRPFLGGRAAHIGTVFPTNDCGQCLPTTEAQAGVRKCFHRNLAIDHPNLHIWRRATVEAVSGDAGDFRVTLRRLPNIVTDACVDCGLCETVCPERNAAGTAPAIYSEFYDGRVVRTVDIETCTFCGTCADVCPVGAIDFGQSPATTTLRAGAILAAVGCEPAPAPFITHLGYGHAGVVTQAELAEMLDDWTAQAAVGRQPLDEVVMIQCAGSRDRRRLPYCSRICCMIALKHALRLRALFPKMKVTICYLELRTAGVGYENWYLAARRAGVDFLRGTPPEVQFDEHGKPVIEVEDMMAGAKRVLRPDLVVLSNGMVPASDTAALTQILGIARNEDGFIEILDRKNRATETTREGVFVAGSAAGPKALVECNTEASAVASEIHNFLRSAGRRSTPASVVDPATCVGCDVCVSVCPFGAIALVERPPDAPRPAAVRDDHVLARIDGESCHACGICAANCPEMAITHNLTDEALLGRLRLLVEGVENPVVGFYCKECAGAAISLSGLRHDAYPENVHLIELPCIGRVSALHIIEAVRLGARGVFLAGCAEGRCQYRSGDVSAAEQMRLAGEFLADAGLPVPVELWHLCAVEGASVGRRIRLFAGRALGEANEAAVVREERRSLEEQRQGGGEAAAGAQAAQALPAAPRAAAGCTGTCGLLVGPRR